MGSREKVLIVLVSIIAIMAIPEIIPYFYPRVSWDRYSDEGRQAILFGEPDKAVEYYKAEVKKTLVTRGVKDPRYIAALEGLAQAYERQGMWLSAEDQFNEALSQLQKPWLRDRQRIKETLNLMAAMYEKKGDTASVAFTKKRIADLNPWAHWFWTCFVLAFMTEALYLGHVLAQPGELEIDHFKVPLASVYVFSLLIATVGMMRGLLMQGMSIEGAVLLPLSISLLAMPVLFVGVFMITQRMFPQDARLLLEGSRPKRS